MEQKTIILLIAIAGACFFWQSLFSGKILLQNDALNFFLMEKQLQVNSLYNMEFPFWNDTIYSGTLLLANSQAGLFYPANIMLFFMKAEQATWLFQPISLILAGITMYFFSRKICLGNPATLVAAITFMGSGQMVTRIFAGHLSLITAYSLIPLVFWSAENALKKKSIFSLIILGIALTLQFFAGFLQLFYFTALFATAYCFFRREKGEKTSRYALGAIIVGIVFVSVSAIQLFPSLELSGQMTRTGGLSTVELGSFSMPPATLAETVLPDIFGNPANNTFWGEPYYWEFTPFIGVAALLLAIIGLRYNIKNRTVLLFTGISLISILFALGKNFPFYQFLGLISSAFGMFRAPARILAIYCFSTAVLAGFGVQTILSANAKQTRKILITSAIAATIFMLAATALFSTEGLLKEKATAFIQQKFGSEGEERVSYLESRIPTAISNIEEDAIRASTALFIACLSIVMLMKKHAKTAIAILVFAVLFELLLFSQLFLEPRTPPEAFAATQTVKALENQQGIFRSIVSQHTLLPEYLAAKFGLELADGYDPTILKNYAELAGIIDRNSARSYDITFDADKSDARLLGLLNVKYFVSQSGIKENPDFLPRAFVVGKAKETTVEQSLEEMREQDFNPRDTVLLENFQETTSRETAFFVPSEFSRLSAQEFEINSRTENDGFLVISMPYYQGWKASIDDKETTIFKADHALMAVKMPQGNHKTRLYFESASFNAGLIVSGIALLAIIGLLSANAMKKLRSKKNA